MLFLLDLKWNPWEKVFFCVEKSIQNLNEMLKEAIIHFCLSDELRFSNIYTL